MGRTKGINTEGYRLRNSDRIAKLYLTHIGQPCRDNVFGNVPRHVCAAAIHFGCIFARKSTATMPCISAVCIGNQLATRQTRVGRRTAHYKSTSRIDEKLSIFVDEFSGQRRPNDVIQNIRAQERRVNCVEMLRRHNHSSNPTRFFIFVILYRNLSLSIR